MESTQLWATLQVQTEEQGGARPMLLSTSVSYIFHSAARQGHLLLAATGHTETPANLDLQVCPSQSCSPSCGPPPGCSARPGLGILSSPPDEAGSAADDPESGWSGPGLNASVGRGRVTMVTATTFDGILPLSQ